MSWRSILAVELLQALHRTAGAQFINNTCLQFCGYLKTTVLQALTSNCQLLRIVSAGPHTTSFSPNMRISGAAFQAWGARNRPGRYSIHYHLAGNAPGAFVRNVAVYKCVQKSSKHHCVCCRHQSLLCPY
jgi:hypothetical protein